jgi:hypothetical protein
MVKSRARAAAGGRRRFAGPKIRVRRAGCAHLEGTARAARRFRLLDAVALGVRREAAVMFIVLPRSGRLFGHQPSGDLARAAQF